MVSTLDAIGSMSRRGSGGLPPAEKLTQEIDRQDPVRVTPRHLTPTSGRCTQINHKTHWGAGCARARARTENLVSPLNVEELVGCPRAIVLGSGGADVRIATLAGKPLAPAFVHLEDGWTLAQLA